MKHLIYSCLKVIINMVFSYSLPYLGHDLWPTGISGKLKTAVASWHGCSKQWVYIAQSRLLDQRVAGRCESLNCTNSSNGLGTSTISYNQRSSFYDKKRPTFLNATYSEFMTVLFNEKFLKGVMTWEKVTSLVCRFWSLPWTNRPNTQKWKWTLIYSPI